MKTTNLKIIFRKIMPILIYIMSFTLIYFSIKLPHEDISFGKGRATEFNNWYYYTANGEKNFLTKGEKISTSLYNPRKYTIYATIPKYLPANSYVFIRAMQEKSKAYVDDILIYQFYERQATQMFSRNTGYVWNMIRIPTNSADKTIKVEIVADYEGSNIISDPIYIGNKYDIVITIILDNLPLIVFLLFMVMAGLSLVIFSLITKIKFFEKMKISSFETDNFIIIGLIIFASGIWLIMRQPSLNALVANNHLRMTLVYTNLFVMAYMSMNFATGVLTNEMHRNILYNLCHIQAFNIFIIYILKFAGLYEYGQVLRPFQIILSCFLALVIYFCILEIRKYNNKRAISFLVMLITVFTLIGAEFYKFNFENRDTGFFSILSVVAVILYLLGYVISTILKTITSSEKANYFEQLSNTDFMTGLNNRTAYMEKIKSLRDNPPELLIVMIIDLNSLKIVNDQYGHANGDNFIIQVGNILTRVFHYTGEIFRIGGDEFAIFMPSSNISYAEDKARVINSMCSDINKESEYPFSVAIGFSLFQKGVDYIDDVIARADANMYKDKKEKSKLKV